MKIALAQYQPQEDYGLNRDLVCRYIGEAGAAGAAMICFNQFFLGMVRGKYDKTLLDTIASAACKNKIAIVTGSLIVNKHNCEATSAYFNEDGEITGIASEKRPVCGLNGLELFETALGPMLTLTALEAYDSQVDNLIQELKPKVILMQSSAISLLEAEAIKKLAIDRSYSQAPLVLTVSMIGSFFKNDYIGCTMAVMQGQILAEAPDNTDTLLLVDADTANCANYQVLRKQVTIPELLRQKLIHEAAH